MDGYSASGLLCPVHGGGNLRKACIAFAAASAFTSRWNAIDFDA